MEALQLTLNNLDLKKQKFIEVEKNLITLGFFSPSSKMLEQVEKKSVSIVRYLDGRRCETTATIIPSRLYGLPVTADQDKYLALQQMIGDLRRKHGTIQNPVGFTAAQLLRVLGKAKSGKSYEEISDWMKRMTATTVNAVVYLAGRKAWVDDTFHVFDRAVSMGTELPDGRVAGMNYIWLSDWQLENINAHYQYPIDLHTYFQLRSHIAKALVPLLQVWLHASMKRGRFEKNYADLCQILNIKHYTHASKIKLGLGPSLDELVKHAYLASWDIEPTADQRDFKLIFVHGAKFFSDRELRQGVKDGLVPALHYGPLLQELVSRGVHEEQARKLLAAIPADQPVRDQLEYGDFLLRTSPKGSFRNPPGFYMYLLRDGVMPPADFETSRVKNQRELSLSDQMAQEAQQMKKEIAYEEYRRSEVERYIDQNLGEGDIRRAMEESMRDVTAHFPESSRWPKKTIEEVAAQRFRAKLANELPLPSFEEFCTQYAGQLDLFTSL